MSPVDRHDSEHLKGTTSPYRGSLTSDEEGFLDDLIEEAKGYYIISTKEDIAKRLRVIRHINSYLETTPRGASLIVAGEKLADLLRESVAEPLVNLYKMSSGVEVPSIPIKQFLDHFAAEVPPPESHKPLETAVVDGIVDEFRGDDAIVVLDIMGKDERRLMSSVDLRAAGITREGTTFSLCMRKLRVAGKIVTETWVEPSGDAATANRVNLRPHSDLAKLKRLKAE